ncbi:MAG: alpha/beta fold hydrolase, partial [Phycisphaerales bacterium]
MSFLGFIALLLTGFALAYGGVVVVVVMALVRPPRLGYAYAVSRSMAGTPEELPSSQGGARSYRPWTFVNGGVRFAVWEVPGDNPRGPICIVTHGWGSSRVRALHRVQVLAPFVRSIVLWDLRGHGESGGHSALGSREEGDLAALIGMVTDGDGAGAGVLLVGSSMGGGISIAAAARDRRVCGVIAQ